MDRWNNEHMNTSVLLDRLKLALLPSLGAWIIRFLGTRLSLQTRGAELVDAKRFSSFRCTPSVPIVASGKRPGRLVRSAA